MKVAKVRLGQKKRNLAGKESEDKLLCAELRGRAVEMKASLSTPVQGFLKNILRQKMIQSLDEVITDFAARNKLIQLSPIPL